MLANTCVHLHAQDDDAPKKPAEFGFRFVGPSVGNRVAAIAGIPGDPTTYYAGAASGGVWKSSDGGEDWTPIFDDEPAQAIGALAVAPSDHSTVWAGTGEAWIIRDTDVGGNGVYKSTDAGQTWQHMGLDEAGRIGRIIVDPANPNIVFVCAVGRATGPQQQRGVFRTTDGGAHWQRVLFADENTGCSGLAMDPQNPRTLFAGMWQVVMRTWGEFSGGPGSGVYVSRDGGNKWERIEGHGLPHSPLGKIDVAVAPTDSSRVYALIQTADQGSLWRSDDGGKSWKVASWDRSLIGRAGYYIRLAISPADENEVLVASSSMHRSLDGGYTFREFPWGGDNHDVWFDPRNADRFVITDDLGLEITTVHGRGFHHVTLPIGQMYHVTTDDQVPYFVYANMQDDSTMRGPENEREPDEHTVSTGWQHELGGCESGWTVPDLTDPNIVWASCYGDEVTRWDARTRQARSVSPWLHTLDSPPTDLKYRCHWTPPLVIDPFDHNTVYYGCQVILRTTDAGQSWKVISPDLSTKDPSRIVSSGGIVGDNLGQFYGEVVYAIAPSEIQKGLIWAGTNDGKVWYTTDAGEHWNDVSANVKMPPWGIISSIAPSAFDPGVAYISVDYHLMDDRDPFIYKTSDFGKSWKKISAGIPAGELSYVRVVAADPNARGVLFAGTGNGLYYSLSDGGEWEPLSTGLPHSPVSWATVQKRFHDLVVSTYGRGIYILDDITPLEQEAREAKTGAARLFAPRPAYRFIRHGGAPITFELKAAPKNDKVHAAIVDRTGKVIRELDGTAKAGMNRLDWDLRYTGPRLVALRTTPPENPHIWEEPRFWGKYGRPITHWGISRKQQGPIAAPGNYAVKLTVDGQSYVQPIEIIPDPSAAGSATDIQRSVELQLRLRDDISRSADMVNSIEWARKQLQDIELMLKEEKAKPDLLKSVTEMDSKMQKVEYNLLSQALTTSDDKYFVAAYKTYFNLLWLYAEAGSGAGDVAGSASYGPTQTELDLAGQLEKQLSSSEADYHDLMQNQLPAFNRGLAEHGIVPVSTTSSDSR